MSFAQSHPITDICILSTDAERAVAFYTGKLGFEMTRRAESFAEFRGAGVTLAVWEIDHLAERTGVDNTKGPGAHKICIAVRLDSAAMVDAAYEELSAKGVVFAGPPADYEWNARGCYFSGPDDELWEIYAWKEGGIVGDYAGEHVA